MSELAQRLASLSPAQRQLLEKRLAEKKPTAEPIAVVGMSCRFAGARNLAEFWRVISEGIEATREVPPDRWDIDALYDATGTETGKMSTRWGGFIDDIDQFDPAFFGIAPREAARMDPQQRLLLEVAWETFENASLPADKMAGTRTAVFVGIGGTDYSKVPAQFVDYFHHIDAHVGTGNALSIASNRISYIFDLHGPSASVDTACSSSSLAIHLAVESLRRGESTAALAGGVNAIITPETTIAFSKARMLSPEGKCRPFDARANGYVRGEGCGLVLLKKLSDAERDDDHILGVIRATSVNQDGRTSGISAPNGESQKECIRAAQAQAGLTPDDFTYIEAHGTGTPLGDPIEMQALSEIFRRKSADQLPLYVSSVKANIGHTETVSGVAGLIKTLLLMRHESFAPQVHFESLNPHIRIEGSRIVIPTRLEPWPAVPRKLAGISSFGFGGTNTHIVVEGPPTSNAGDPIPLKQRPGENGRAEPIATEDHAAYHLLKISGRASSAIARQAAQFADVLGENNEWTLAEICHAANNNRCDFNHRAAVVASSRDEMEKQLRLLVDGKRSPAIRQGTVKGLTRTQVAFLFTGQGSQYPQMGRELYGTQPVFREAIDECAATLDKWLDIPLTDVLFPTNETEAVRIDNTLYTQPCLVAIEYATARLWQSWGVEPQYLLGHSVGEYAAAIIGGAMSLTDGMSLIANRARLMQQVTTPGKMAAIFASEAEVAAAVAGQLDQISVATINGPANTVISGDATVVDQFVERFAQQGLSVQPLKVSHAFHSPHMDVVLDEFERFASTLEYKNPTIPIISNVTGRPYDGPPNARYWRDHLRGAVRFSDGVMALAEAGANLWVEVGPSASLVGMAKRCLDNKDVSLIATMRKGASSAQSTALACGEFYSAGGTVAWRHLSGPTPPRPVLIPNYPFEKSRYWLEPNETPLKGNVPRQSVTGRPATGHPLLGKRIPTVWSHATYEAVVDNHQPGFLNDHQVQGSVVVPAAAFIEQAVAAAEKTFGEGNHVINNLSVQQALFLPDGSQRLLQVAVAPESSGEATFESHSTPLDEALSEHSAAWTMHAVATLKHQDNATFDELPEVRLTEIRERTTDRRTREEFYRLVGERGLSYGPSFQVLGGVDRNSNEALAPLDPPKSVLGELSRYRLHPVLGDACLQTLASTVPLESDGSYSPFTYLPVGVRQVQLLRPIESVERLFCYAIRRSDDDSPSPEFVESDIVIVDEEGNAYVAFLGARVQRIGRGKQAATTDPADWLYQVQWKDAPLTGLGQLPSGRWLLLSDEGGVGQTLESQITSAGGQLTVVTAGDEYSSGHAEANVTRVTCNPLVESHFQHLLDEYFSDGQCAGVIDLWSLDIPDAETADAWNMSRAQGSAAALLLLKRLVRHPWKESPRSWFVTRGAQSVGDDSPVAMTQAPLLGLIRVAQMEHPELRPTLLDLDPDTDTSSSAGKVYQEIASSINDQQIAYRGDTRRVAMLSPASQLVEAAVGNSDELSVPTGSAFQLRITTAGSFDALKLMPIQRRKPESGEVEIEVHATGLNFSDVLKALGLYPGIKDEIVPLGIETSGVVTAVGEGVDRFQVGQQVMGVAPYAFASHTITPEYTLVAKPENIDHPAAATIPITFLTAYYALARLADLQPGERLLIHAAAGGVGLAAIQIAQQIGADIYATAGSDEKHEFLRSLGVKHIYSSRSLDFHDEILEATQREGVDVVLNSLPGEAITKSLQLLRAYGRFLEIGKIDIYQNRMLGLLPFQDNLSYHAIDLDRLLRQRPEYVQKLFAELMRHFESGDYEPLPHTTFAREETIDAFRYMSARKNIGKVVVNMSSPDRKESEHKGDNLPRSVRSDGSYLITGGLGGLGLLVADWLVSQNAGGLVLVSRRGEPTEGAGADAIARFRERGTKVSCLAADVVDLATLQSGLSKLPADLPPVRGVIHAAGVLADGVIADMSLESLDKAMLPKTVGAWNLHVATADFPLDFFVLFSSVAAILGSPGQGNYAAGNAALDALAHSRRRQGLPAVSINWGPWAESGMAAEQGRGEGIQSRGMDLLPAAEGLELMGRLISADVTQASVMDVHWDALTRLLGNRRPKLLDQLSAERTDGSSDAAASNVDRAFRAEFTAAPPKERVAMLRDYIQRELARIMSFEPDQLDVTQPLAAFGLDSLMALELKNNLEGRLDFTLPMAKLLEGPSIDSLAEAVAELLASDQPTPPRGLSDTWTPLVELKRGDESLAPLVLFPALGGDVRYYGQLVHSLKSPRTVLALRPRGIDDTNEPHTTIDELTRDYVAALKQRQPRGPYYLAGWSAGGVTAFAIAAALRRAGDDVAMLALIDTPLPSIYRNLDPDDDIRFLCDMVVFTNRFAGTKIDVSYDQLQKLPHNERFPIALKQAREQGMFPPEISDQHVQRLVNAGEGMVRASQQITPQPIDIAMHLFQPETEGGLFDISGHVQADDLGWSSEVGQELIRHRVPGDHFTMMTGDGARQLARVLDELIGEL